MHLVLVRRLMQATRAADFKGAVVNASYPDVTHAALAAEGLSPLVGIGNVANAVPGLRPGSSAPAAGGPSPKSTSVSLRIIFSAIACPAPGPQTGRPIICRSIAMARKSHWTRATTRNLPAGRRAFQAGERTGRTIGDGFLGDRGPARTGPSSGMSAWSTRQVRSVSSAGTRSASATEGLRSTCRAAFARRGDRYQPTLPDVRRHRGRSTRTGRCILRQRGRCAAGGARL